MSQSEDTVEFIEIYQGQDQVLSFRELKPHFDKKFEAINKKKNSVETKH